MSSPNPPPGGLAHPAAVHALAFIPGGNRLISAGADGTLRLWDLDTRKEVHRLDGHTGLVMAVAHAAFRTQLDVDPSPAAIVASLNRILCRTGGPRSFFSCCYLLLAPNGEFVATTAGHPPVLKIDTEGKILSRIGFGSYPLRKDYDILQQDTAWVRENLGIESGQ